LRMGRGRKPGRQCERRGRQQGIPGNAKHFHFFLPLRPARSAWPLPADALLRFRCSTRATVSRNRSVLEMPSFFICMHYKRKKRRDNAVRKIHYVVGAMKCARRIPIDPVRINPCASGRLAGSPTRSPASAPRRPKA
jgi:hypothetical protein